MMSRGLKTINLLLISLFFSIFLNATEVDFELDKSSKLAKKEQKHVMLFLHKNYCGYCENMFLHLDETNISKSIEKNFILLDINRDEEDESVSYQGYTGTNIEFLKELGVDFYPALVFIDGNNKIIFDVSGYRTPKKILSILNYVSSNSYTDMSLEEFKDEEDFLEEDEE
ncbi:MAG: thioredoxin fold domain-containing protein [Sulfurovaceae bacterium]|nr:thioredoxin fold domain-containing protein [Sulfurovaceae bacterium]